MTEQTQARQAVTDFALLALEPSWVGMDVPFIDYVECAFREVGLFDYVAIAPPLRPDDGGGVVIAGRHGGMLFFFSAVSDGNGMTVHGISDWWDDAFGRRDDIKALREMLIRDDRLPAELFALVRRHLSPAVVAETTAAPLQ